MQCGPVQHRVNAKTQAARRPFEHLVLVQPTEFQPRRSPDSDKRVEFQVLYKDLIDDELRTRRICDDVVESVNSGRSPLVLTERNDHLDRLEHGLGEAGHDIGDRRVHRQPSVAWFASTSWRRDWGFRTPQVDERSV